jgi:hydrophobic/amphiphilic exporter-1 (mainly G- bacteria), HAE1 family
MYFITRLSLKLGAVVVLAVVGLFGAGIFAATQVQQDLLPNISFPAFIVVTPYPGASPEIVDQGVTLPVVNALQGVPGVSSVTSTSTAGASLVIVLFKDGADTTAARQNIATRLDGVRALLPQQAIAPTIQDFSTSSLPILQYAVTADESQGDLAGQLRAIAIPKLKGLAGVSSVVITGAPTDEVDVILDPAKLAANGLSAGQVAAALQQATLVQSIGALKEGNTVVPLQVSGSLTSLDQIGTIFVSPGGVVGRPTLPAVQVNQLGTVQFVSLPADTITRTNGKPSIGLRVLKAADGNTVTVANEVKAALPDLRTRMGNGIQFASIQDQATPISNAIAAILQEGLLGAIFAIGIIFLFLRSGRATIVAAVSIPLSLLAALLVLWWQGITLNILTLGGMMVAIGRVVDDAIVVLENISRHVAEGENPLVAAYTGAREITTAVTSSTLATVAVFLPIVFLTGIAGSFFRPFALTVVTALIASLAVAVTVVPLLASRLLKPPSPDKVERRLDYNWMQRIYVPVIRWATSHRAITLAVASLMFIGSMALLPLVRVNLLDKSASPNFPIAITMPDNSTLSETSAETEKVEGLIRGVPGISAFQATVGGISDPFAAPGTVPADPTQASVTVLVNQGAYDQALQGVTQALKGYSGPARVDLGQATSSSNSSSTQMQVDVHAPGQDTLALANSQVLAALSHVSGLSQLKSNLAASKPQYKLVPTAKLGQSGLTLQQVALIVGQQVNGIVATQATLPQGRVNVRVQLPPGTADNAAALARTPIPTALGVVPLSTLATLEQVPGPQAVSRTDGDRTASITGTITSDNTQKVQADVTRALAGLSLPAGASTSTGGVFAQLSSLLTQFAIAILAAIGLVYLIMVATFRSLLKPLVLLVSIPFAASGAIVALVVTGTSLSLPGMIGLLMLIGIVVTNAIVLLDLVEQYRDRGLSLDDALIEGGRHRLRPILMTAFATMLALVPLAVSGSSGGAFISAPLAIVVIGGLFTSTLLTLVLVPVLYSIASRFTGARSTRDLDALFDAAQERRFTPIGGRGAVLLPAAITADGRARAFTVSVLVEPEPGRPGDRTVLERLAGRGYSIAPIEGSAKVTVTLPMLEAESETGARDVALSTVRGMLPRDGYLVSNPEVLATAGAVSGRAGTEVA